MPNLFSPFPYLELICILCGALFVETALWSSCTYMFHGTYFTYFLFLFKDVVQVFIDTRNMLCSEVDISTKAAADQTLHYTL